MGPFVASFQIAYVLIHVKLNLCKQGCSVSVTNERQPPRALWNAEPDNLGTYLNTPEEANTRKADQ